MGLLLTKSTTRIAVHKPAFNPAGCDFNGPGSCRLPAFGGSQEWGAWLLGRCYQNNPTYGAYRSARVAANLQRLEIFFAPKRCLPFDDACVHTYGQLRTVLAAKGVTIGANTTVRSKVEQNQLVRDA